MSYLSTYKRAKSFYIQGNHRSSLKEFSKLDSEPLTPSDKAVVHHFKALCYANLKNLKKSIIEFDAAIKHRPKYLQVYLDKGMTYYFFYCRNWFLGYLLTIFGKKNNLEKALKSFEDGLLAAAILQSPENAELWYYRGYMLELLGNEKEAGKSYKKSLGIDTKQKNYENSHLFKNLLKRKKSPRRTKKILNKNQIQT
jgi:tetratricopeptide (TPR) repeat protein